LAESVTPDPGTGIEPNDQVASATMLGLSLPVTATIGWARDEDVFCMAEGTAGKIRWKVRDGLRDSGVLEVTPMRGQEEGAPIRIHLQPSGKVSASDVVNPWQSEFLPADSGGKRCLRVRITKDPWSFERVSVIPNGGSEAYVVEAESIP